LSQLLSKVTAAVLRQIFNVSALLLDDALLKGCYRSRLVFNCCFKTLTFHKVV